MQNKILRLTEAQLNKLVKEGVKKILAESDYASARDAYKDAIENVYDRKTYKEIPGGREKADAAWKNLMGVYRNNFDPELDVVVVGGEKDGVYKAKDLEKYFEITGYEEPSQNPRYNDTKLIGMPHIKGYIGPMWDGGKARYETQEVYDFLSL